VSSHVALLRGVNVGGVRVPMARLRELATGLGWSDVATHLNSGNLLLSTDEPADTVAARLEEALRAEFGRTLPVLVRTPAQLEAALAGVRPAFPDAEEKRLHLAFLSADPGADADERLGDVPPEEHARLASTGTEMVLHYPDGMGRTKLTLDLLERRLGVTATVRGLGTVAGLIARSAG
jgi:uncharacterized protein (DUF1697 family)